MITPDARPRRGSERRKPRAAWVMADQGVNSLSNVIATVIVAAAVPGRVFAVFATGQLILALGQTVMLSAAGDRLLQSAPEWRPARYAAGVRFFRWSALLVAALGAVAVVDGRIAPYAAAAAVATVSCAMDHARVALVTCDRVRTAFVTDCAFALLQIGGLAAWSTLGAPGGAAGAWAIWGAAAALVLTPYAVGLLRAFPWCEPERIRDAVSLRYGVEMAAVNGSGQLAQLVASTSAGLGLNAMLRGSQIGFGVVVLVLVASRVLLIPLFARPDARRVLTAAVVGVAALCLLTGALTGIAAANPSLRFLVAGQRLGLAFVALTTATYLAVGVHQLLFYLLRARHDDRAVGVSRVVVVAGFAATALAAALSRSGEVFLAGSALTWSGASVVMVWRRRRGGATVVHGAQVDPSCATTAVAA